MLEDETEDASPKALVDLVPERRLGYPKKRVESNVERPGGLHELSHGRAPVEAGAIASCPAKDRLDRGASRLLLALVRAQILVHP